jgi:predicted dehydrogenase
MDSQVPTGFRVLHRGAINDFLSAIQEGRAPLVGIAECRTALQVTTAIYKSAMTGMPVALPITQEDPFYDRLPPAGFALPASAGD